MITWFLVTVPLHNAHVPTTAFVRGRSRASEKGVSPRYFCIAHPLIRLWLLPPPHGELVDSLEGVCAAITKKKSTSEALSFLVSCVGAALVPGAVISAHKIHYMCRHVLEHVYRPGRLTFKHRGESGRVLIRMNAMGFDKHELAAPAEPVGSPAQPLSSNTPANAATGCP